jgi:hypothetical protein
MLKHDTQLETAPYIGQSPEVGKTEVTGKGENKKGNIIILSIKMYYLHRRD